MTLKVSDRKIQWPLPFLILSGNLVKEGGGTDYKYIDDLMRVNR